MKHAEKWLFCLLAMACGRLAAQPTAPAVVRGRVLHPTDSVVLLAGPRSLLGLTPTFKQSRLNQRGEFQFVLDSLSRPVAAEWGVGRPATVRHYTDLWLAPGDTLTLTVDARRFDKTLQFAGPNAAVNYYRAAQRRAHTDNFYDAPEGRTEPRSPARMRALANHYRQRAEAVLREAHRQRPLPPTLWHQEMAAIRYDWGHALLTSTHRYEYKSWPQGRVVRRMPEAYYGFLAELPLPQDSLLAYPAYRTFAHSYASYLLRERRQRLDFPTFMPLQFPWGYDTVRQVLPAGATRNYLLAQVLDDLLRHGRPGDFSARMTDFQALGADAELQAALARQVAHMAEFRVGQPAPDFTLTDLNGQPVYLSDFRGRLVYIDFWASWCKPCRADAPALRTLQTQFVGRADQIVFLSLSIDTNAAAWRRAVAADQPAAAPNQAQVLGQLAEPALRRVWEERGVPQCWLVGPDGLIIDSNVPHPSNAAVVASLEAALQQLSAKKLVP